MPFDGAIDPLVLWSMPECDVFAFVFVGFIFLDLVVFDIAGLLSMPGLVAAREFIPEGDDVPVDPLV